MVTFWKPVGRGPNPLTPDSKYKQLGRGLYELWARCDACQASDAFWLFTLWERGTEVGTLCGDCAARPDLTGMLLADGWHRC